MLPASQPSFPPSSTQTSLYGSSQPYGSSQSFSSSQGLSYADLMSGFDSRTFSQQSLQADPSFTSAEYNTPEMFKQNMHIALELLARVQTLARSALAGIEQAYRPGTNPIQTSADITALKQVHQELIGHLRTSGVGALPLLSGQMTEPPSEQKLMTDTTSAVQQLYDQQKRLQQTAANVASLLTVPEPSQPARNTKSEPV